jgi:CDP-4-dehydro-6-deoxyglucose reductase, E1
MDAKPFYSSPLDLAVNTVTKADLRELIAWLKLYPRLTMFDETLGFEKAWSKWQGVKYSVLCNSGSSANLLMYAALEAAGRAGKKKVVVPATGWLTTVSPAIQLGFKPLMCESQMQTFGSDMDCLEKIIRKQRPETVVLVHTLGVPNDMTAVQALRDKYGFNLLEDCCASHGAAHRGKKVGSFGTMSSFSFYYGHHMSTIEGGVVCTDDEELYWKLLMLRSHGWCKDLPKREHDRLMRKYKVDDFHNPFTFVYPGYNLRSTDLNAKLGLIQLRKLDDTVSRRVRNHAIYQKRLQGKIAFAPGCSGDTISSISFCALAESTAHRKQIVRRLEKAMIDTRIFTAGNLGRHPFWFERYGEFRAPVADRLYDCGFFLPNNQAIKRTDIEFICDTVTDA